MIFLSFGLLRNIGKTVLPEAIRVLEAAGFEADYVHADIGWDFWCKEGNPLPERTLELLEKHKISLSELEQKIENWKLTFMK